LLLESLVGSTYLTKERARLAEHFGQLARKADSVGAVNEAMIVLRDSGSKRRQTSAWPSPRVEDQVRAAARLSAA